MRSLEIKREKTGQSPVDTIEEIEKNQLILLTFGSQGQSIEHGTAQLSELRKIVPKDVRKKIFPVKEADYLLQIELQTNDGYLIEEQQILQEYYIKSSKEMFESVQPRTVIEFLKPPSKFAINSGSGLNLQITMSPIEKNALVYKGYITVQFKVNAF